MSDEAAPAVHGAVAAVMIALHESDQLIIDEASLRRIAEIAAPAVLRWTSRAIPVSFDRAPWRWMLDQADEIDPPKETA